MMKREAQAAIAKAKTIRMVMQLGIDQSVYSSIVITQKQAMTLLEPHWDTNALNVAWAGFPEGTLIMAAR